MNTNKLNLTTLEDRKVNVKTVLSGLWASLMFIYVYVDIFDFYRLGEIEHIIAGNFGPFPTTQGALLSALVLMLFPGAMIFLSLILNAKASRWANIIVGVAYVLVTIGNIIGETWAFYIFGSIVELVLLLLIIGYAWKWPRKARETK